MWWLVALGLSGLALGGIWLAIRPQFRIHFATQTAKQEFLAKREQVQAAFFDQAAASGKPRGLRWVRCDWSEEILIARHRESAELAGFVELTIRFDAVPGGEMEDVEAVHNLRLATAIFHFRDGAWQSDGEAMFNHAAREAVGRYGEAWEIVE